MTEREVMADLVRFVGVITYGKERWFKQNGCWYDRLFGDYIQNETLLERIRKAIEDEVCDEYLVKCKDCTKHNKAIGDYEEEEKCWIWKPDACPLVEYRGKAQGHEFDYQYCSYGKRKDI